MSLSAKVAFSSLGIGWPDFNNNRTRYRLVQIVCTGFVAMALSSCTVSKQLGSVTTDSNVATGSISEVPKDTALAATDAEAIKSTVIKSETFSEGSNLLSWANPETGNSGTITAIERTIGAEGHPCRKFETTVSSFNGVSIYNGETCEAKKDIWTISWLLPKDFGI